MLKVNCITKDFFLPLSFHNILALNFKRRLSCRALNNVSFDLPDGYILAVLGINGAGKTTLLKIISTLILPEKGTVEVNGYCLGKDDDKIKANIGLVCSSERSFYNRLTGRQNLEFFANLYGLNAKKAKIRIEKLSCIFKVDYLDKRFDTYSSGMQQKLGLMRALLHNPGLLLLDEPTKSLDYTTANELKKFLKEDLVKKQKKTVIFTTHHIEEDIDFADYFMILHKGKVCAFGTLQELKTTAKNSSKTLKEIFLELTSKN